MPAYQLCWWIAKKSETQQQNTNNDEINCIDLAPWYRVLVESIEDELRRKFPYQVGKESKWMNINFYIFFICFIIFVGLFNMSHLIIAIWEFRGKISQFFRFYSMVFGHEAKKFVVFFKIFFKKFFLNLDDLKKFYIKISHISYPPKNFPPGNSLLNLFFQFTLIKLSLCVCISNEKIRNTTAIQSWKIDKKLSNYVYESLKNQLKYICRWDCASSFHDL